MNGKCTCEAGSAPAATGWRCVSCDGDCADGLHAIGVVFDALPDGRCRAWTTGGNSYRGEADAPCEALLVLAKRMAADERAENAL